MDSNSYAIRRASWAKIIAEANNSGLTKSRWCREHGIRLRQFHYWQKRIREFLLEHPDTKFEDFPGNDRRLLAPVSEQSFCEISIPQETPAILSRPLPEAPASHSALMLQVNDLRLYIGEGFSETALSSVIRVIRNA